MTPEGKIKKRISALLKEYEPELYYWMPVPGGYGESTVDYIVCFRGKFCGVEAKAPGKKPTTRQQQIINRITLSGGTIFVIDGENTLIHLQNWLTRNS